MPQSLSTVHPSAWALRQSADAAVEVVARRSVSSVHAVPLPRLTRYRGGTFSPTVHSIRFADGSTARTDLVRLNPNITAYSLDFHGTVAPTPVRYRPAAWGHTTGLRARFRAAAIDAVLAASYPVVDTVELSTTLRRAGLMSGRRNLRDDEAIAATQAAIWKLANDLDLDSRPRTAPSAVVARAGGIGIDGVVADDEQGVSLAADISARAPLTVDLDFDHSPMLGGVRLDLDSALPAGLLRVRVLRRTRVGEWTEVAGSAFTPTGEGPWSHRLPPLATAADNRSGRVIGYPHYRVEIATDSVHCGRIAVRDLAVELVDTARFANADNVVALYRYLLEVAQRSGDAAGSSAVHLDVEPRRSTSTTPTFRYRGPRAATITGRVVDAAGDIRIEDIGVVQPGGTFAVTRDLDPGDRMTISAAMPSAAAVEARVLLACDAQRPGLTPLVTSVPSARETVVELIVFATRDGAAHRPSRQRATAI